MNACLLFSERRGIYLDCSTVHRSSDTHVLYAYDTDHGYVDYTSHSPLVVDIIGVGTQR